MLPVTTNLNHDLDNYKNIRKVYIYRLCDNFGDFVFISLFYLFLLYMENFWDFIFYKKIVSIQEADFDFRNSEKLQMDYESELA